MDQEPARQGLQAPVVGRGPLPFSILYAIGWNFKELRGAYTYLLYEIMVQGGSLGEDGYTSGDPCFLYDYLDR